MSALDVDGRGRVEGEGRLTQMSRGGTITGVAGDVSAARELPRLPPGRRQTAEKEDREDHIGCIAQHSGTAQEEEADRQRRRRSLVDAGSVEDADVLVVANGRDPTPTPGQKGGTTVSPPAFCKSHLNRMI